MIEKIKKALNVIVYALAFFAAAYAVYSLVVDCSEGKRPPAVSFNDSTGVYNKLYYESEIAELKKENKELYDSLESSKEKIAFLVQFTASKKYSTGKVTLKEDTVVTADSKTFEYGNSNDTLSYSLKINAEKEPNWYSLDIFTKDSYTVVDNAYEGGFNHLTINGGTSEISDVTVFKKSEKTSLIKRFVIGPTISFGYDLSNNRLSPIVGIGVTYNLFGD